MAWSDLDAARTSGDSVAAHVADHNQVHAFANRMHDEFGVYYVHPTLGNAAYTGTNMADSFATINAAVTAMNANGGGEMVLGKGTHAVSSTPDQFLVPHVVRGVGQSTIITPTSPNVTVFRAEFVSGGAQAWATYKDFVMESGAGGDQGHVGIDIRCDDWYLENIHWRNFGDAHTTSEEVWEARSGNVSSSGGTTLTLTSHGLADGDCIAFDQTGSGGSGFAVARPYFVNQLSSSTFELHEQLQSVTDNSDGPISSGSSMSGTWTFRRFNNNRPWPFLIRSAGGTRISDWGNMIKCHTDQCYGGGYFGPGNGDVYGYMSRRHTRGTPIYIEMMGSLLNARYRFHGGHIRTTGDTGGTTADSQYGVYCTKSPGSTNGDTEGISFHGSFFSEGSGTYPTKAHFYVARPIFLDWVKASNGASPAFVTGTGDDVKTVLNFKVLLNFSDSDNFPTGSPSNVWFNRLPPEEYTTAGLPTAGNYPRGYAVWDTTTDTYKYSDGVSAWN